jgi:hypothetical protein
LGKCCLKIMSECSVTANIPVLGTGDSGFESRHSDRIFKPLPEACHASAVLRKATPGSNPGTPTEYEKVIVYWTGFACGFCRSNPPERE